MFESAVSYVDESETMIEYSQFEVMLSEANNRIRKLQFEKSQLKEAFENQVDSLNNLIQNKEKQFETKHVNEIESIESAYNREKKSLKDAISELENVRNNLESQLNTISQGNKMLEEKNQELEQKLHEQAQMQRDSIKSNNDDQDLIDSLAQVEKIGDIVRKSLDKSQIETEHGIEYWKNKALAFEASLCELTTKYQREFRERKKFYNQIQDLKGNIRVFVRCRPMLQHEIDKKSTNVITFHDSETLTVNDVNNKNKIKNCRFRFDSVFNPSSANDTVYESTVQSYVQSVLDGYNVTIFAYGQTGTGKTYTMNFVNSSAINDLFERKNNPDFAEEWKIEIKVSLLEIYNEKIIDLLADNVHSNKDSDYKIRHNSDKNMIYVENLRCVEVETPQDVLQQIQNGSKNRTVAQTKMNVESSRSHSLLIIFISGKNIITNVEFSSKLNLIDLAGSERIKKSKVQGKQLLEAQNINKSLSALGDVIEALWKKQKHIPYRNSKLTHILQDSLGKSAKTLMFVNISPADFNCSETLSTLRFAERAKRVELGQSKKNVV